MRRKTTFSKKFGYHFLICLRIPPNLKKIIPLRATMPYSLEKILIFFLFVWTVYYSFHTF